MALQVYSEGKQEIKVGCCGFATDKELEILRKKISEKPTYVMFNNNTMKEDALRFTKLLFMERQG
jgi:uncharacterized protein YecE (DUF72 family)